jgi:AcrR family transcriptional regulator
MADRILDSAFMVFGERGLQATTIKEIAERAGVAAGSVYTHFPDKERLFIATVKRGWDGFLAELDRIALEQVPRKVRIERLLQTGFDTLAMALPLLQGMFSDSRRLNLLRGRLEKLCDLVERITAPEPPAAISQPLFRDEGSRRAAVRVVILGIFFTAALAPRDGVEGELEKMKTAIRDLLSGGGR